MAPQKSQRERSIFLALLLFIGATGLIFAYWGTEDSKRAPGSTQVANKTEKYEKSVNRHLMFTNENIQMQRQRLQAENSQLMNTDFSSTRPQGAYQNENKLDLTPDTRAVEMANELGRGERREEYSSPHEVVQKELFNEQQAQEYTQAYKEEYARQFVENARRGGYKVILSEDLSRVISVTPLRNPSQKQLDLFSNPNGDALQ